MLQNTYLHSFLNTYLTIKNAGRFLKFAWQYYLDKMRSKVSGVFRTLSNI